MYTVQRYTSDAWLASIFIDQTFWGKLTRGKVFKFGINWLWIVHHFFNKFRCGILKMVGPKKQDFWPKLKGFFLNTSMNYGSSKSAKIVHSKSIFNVKNQPNFFKKNSSKNINLGDPFLLKTFFFLHSIFEPLYFLKLRPIFVGPTLCQFTKYSNIIWLQLIFE